MVLSFIPKFFVPILVPIHSYFSINMNNFQISPTIPKGIMIQCCNFSRDTQVFQYCALVLWTKLVFAWLPSKGDLYYVSIFLDFFWPTHYIFQNKYWILNVSKNGHFSTPPTQSFCWRNIEMVLSRDCSSLVTFCHFQWSVKQRQACVKFLWKEKEELC